jgi:hypothetical protein
MPLTLFQGPTIQQRRRIRNLDLGMGADFPALPLRGKAPPLQIELASYVSHERATFGKTFTGIDGWCARVTNDQVATSPSTV